MVVAAGSLAECDPFAAELHQADESPAERQRCLSGDPGLREGTEGGHPRIVSVELTYHPRMLEAPIAAILSPSDLSPLAVVAGYIWAIGCAGWAMPRLLIVVGTRHKKGQQWHRAALGLVEQVVTVTGVLLLASEVILGWVVFKTALRWGDWGKAAGLFNRYAIGTVVSLTFGASGGALAYALSTGNRSLAAAALLGPWVLAGFVYSLYRGPKWWKGWWDPEVPEEEGPG